MNWKQVKNLLLLLLAAVNCLLFIFVYNSYIEEKFTDADTAAEAASILKENGISVSETLLTVQNDTADTLSASYTREDYLCYVASLLFGEEAQGIYLLPDGIRAETESGSTALLGYDFSISYIHPDLDESRLHTAENIAKQPTETKDCTAEQRALETLLALPKGALNDTPCLHADGYAFITVTQRENGIPVYGMQCQFVLSGEQLIAAEGKYCFGVPSPKSSEPLLNRINILFSEKERGKTGSITDMALCYTLYEDAQNGELLFVPAYALTYEDGERLAISAISGDLY